MKQATILKKIISGSNKDRPSLVPGKLSSTTVMSPKIQSRSLSPSSPLTGHPAMENLSAVDLPGVMTAMNGFIDDSEADFMLLGIGLRSVYSNVTELTDLMLGTVKQVTAEEEGGFLEQGRQILKASLAEIRTYHDGVKGDLDRINAVLADLENLSTTSKQIKSFAKSLKTVALIMLVENGRTIDYSVNIFSDVAREIKELSVNITTIANDVYKHVEKARTMHRVSREQVSASIKRLEALTSQIEATVQESAYETEMLLQLSVDAVERAGRRSRDISRQVAEIVVGVQFHDNMKQRISHIVSVLATIVQAAENKSSAGCPRETDGEPSAASILRDLAALLKEIDNELINVFQKNRAALQGIEQEVSALLKELQGMASDDAFDESMTLVQDPFSHLKDTLTQLHTLLDRGTTLYNRIQQTAEDVSGITAELSKLLTIVRGISSHTHNKAINSIIAADKQGEKAGAMKLLAQEMNGLASQSDVFTQEVETNISSILRQTGDIGRRETKHCSGTGNPGGAISRLNDVLNDISLGYESFRKDSLMALERAGGLKKAIDATGSGLDFFKAISEKIEAFRQRLLLIADLPGMDDLTIDVETAALSHMPGKNNPECQDNVILFENVRRSSENKTDGPGYDRTLGDNVELF